MKYFSSILIIFGLFVGFSACSDEGPDPDGHSSSAASNSQGSNSSSDYLTIMSYNVENFDKGGDRPSGTYSTIANTVKTNQTDIAFFSEVQNNDGDESSFDSALTATGWPMPHHRFSSMSDGFNSLGYFSRYPVSDVSEVAKSTGPRTIYRFKVTLGQDQIWFYGAHLKSFTDSESETRRKTQARALANYIRSNHDPKTEYIVILGDMNTMNKGDWTQNPPATGGSSTVDYLELRDDSDPANNFTSITRIKATGMNYTSGKSTYGTSWNYQTGLPLDHIILSPALYAKYVNETKYRVGSGTKASNPSDHYLMVIRLRL